MMDDRKNFVLAVMIALAVPLIFGTVYFYKLSQERGSNANITKLEGVTELYLFGEKYIEGVSNVSIEDNDYMRGDFLEFEIDYASGPNNLIDYDLKLVDLKSARNVSLKNLKWRLVRLLDGGAFEQITNGTFSSSNSTIVLGEHINIAIGQNHKYRLFYYLNGEIKNAQIQARLVVEKE